MNNDSSSDRQSRWNGARVAAAVFGVLLFAYSITFVVKVGAPMLMWALASATVATYLWWYALRGDANDTRQWMAAGRRAGVTLGIIGLVLGYIGPLIFMPDANQGPLFGIFGTGPAGFVLGSIAGVVLYARRRNRAAESRSSSRTSSRS